MEKAIPAKWKAFKAWKIGKDTRASYDAAKLIARHAVHHARQEANKVYENIDPKSSEVYCLANQFRRENTDVVGDKRVKNDAGEMSVSEDSKQKAWLVHYQRLLNVKLDCDQTTCLTNHLWKAHPLNHLSDEGGQSTGPIRHNGGDDMSSQ